MKVVCKCCYVHKSNLKELLLWLPVHDACALTEFLSETDVEYDIIKYDKERKRVSLIQCSDWDTVNEPTVGDSYIYDFKEGSEKYVKARSKNPQIYHHKWMFVADDYAGFDVAKAKERSEQWGSLPNIDKNRIGNKDFWVKFLSENGMEI